MGCTWCWNDYHRERRLLVREAAAMEVRKQTSMLDSCNCTSGRVERNVTIGAHTIRYWVCRCPKERRWSTRHDAGNKARPVKPLETFERRYPIGGK